MMGIKGKNFVVALKLIIFILTICELFSPLNSVIAAVEPKVEPISSSDVKINVVSDTGQKIKSLTLNMTLEQKVGQMIFYAFRWDSAGKAFTKIDKNIEKMIKDYGFGGMILFSENIQSTAQVTDFIKSILL